MRYQFVDCRWELENPRRGRELYLSGHIPGASFLDVEQDLSSPAGAAGRHPLPSSEHFATAAGRAGIGDGVFVVAYGSLGGGERLWWLLRHYGHDDCAVLDLDAWLGPLRAGEEQIEPRQFTPVPRSRGGQSVWENVVTSCATCNHKKGNRTLEEAQMTLHTPPKPPTPVLFIKVAAPRIPDGWQPYLGGLATA